MIEIALNELSKWYLQKLNTIYSKQKQALKKLLERVDKSIIELKQAVNQMKDRKSQVELDEKSAVFVDRFYSKIKENVDNLKIPEEPMAEDVANLMETIKKVFIDMNESGRKNIPRFAEQFKIELKSIDMGTRKISETMTKVDEYIRKQYSDVKEVEVGLKRIPKLESFIERIEHAKKTVEGLNQQYEELQKTLSSLENQLIELENHPIIKQKGIIEKRLMEIQLEFDEKIKFKKALKKLKNKLEKSASFKGITEDQVKKYSSDSINNIALEGENHPNLTQFLIKLRLIIEQDPNSVQLKAEALDKTLENIDQIINKGLLKSLIQEYNEKVKELKSLDQQLEKENLTPRLNEIKNAISTKTQTLEHFGGDLKNKTTEYRGLLEKLKEEREDLQNKIKQYFNEDVKINISFSA